MVFCLNHVCHVSVIYNSFREVASIFESSLKKIEKMSIKTNTGVSGDIDKEKMFHALESNGSES